MFEIGSTVYHKTKKKYGTVVSSFPSGDSHHYYVNHSGWTWSVPEEFLVAKNPPKKPQSLQLVESPEKSNLPQVELKPVALYPTIGAA